MCVYSAESTAVTVTHAFTSEVKCYMALNGNVCVALSHWRDKCDVAKPYRKGII